LIPFTVNGVAYVALLTSDLGDSICKRLIKTTDQWFEIVDAILISLGNGSQLFFGEFLDLALNWSNDSIELSNKSRYSIDESSVLFLPIKRPFGLGSFRESYAGQTIQ
jgi:hypothetical protein